MFEKIIKLIADTEKIAPNDDLSEIVSEYKEAELDENSLDLVSAASKQAYDDFKQRLK